MLCFETLANLIYPSLSYYNLRRRSTKYSSMVLFAINTIPPDQHPLPSTDPVTTLILSITLPDYLLWRTSNSYVPSSVMAFLPVFACYLTSCIFARSLQSQFCSIWFPQHREWLPFIHYCDHHSFIHTRVPSTRISRSSILMYPPIINYSLPFRYTNRPLQP